MEGKTGPRNAMAVNLAESFSGFEADKTEN
jgi:hypothetical protein